MKKPPNLLTRRQFLGTSSGLALGFSSLMSVPGFVKRALAEGSIGLNGKKLLFIWLRGANDGLNSLVPVGDDAYYAAGVRPDIAIPKDPGTDYSEVGQCDFPINGGSNDPTYAYDQAIRLGNGFAGLHPSLKFLASVYNAGELALIHRVAYPRQSRSHFDSQNYWENGVPRNNLAKDGIFYRTMVESGLALTAPLTGISVQSSLPLILRGSGAAMTNLSDPTRYDLLGIPNNTAGNNKADAAIIEANGYPFYPKRNRDMLRLQYQNVVDTLEIFANIPFEETANTFQDDEVTDNDTEWAAAHGGRGYYLFPTNSEINGGWRRPNNTTRADKFIVSTAHHSLFERLKATALILNHTDAIVGGTEYGGFDTHNNQGGVTGTHANLNRALGWAFYALRKYFTQYSNKVHWNDLVVVTLTEFGRTTIQNGNNGTDHAEGGLMMVGGGGVRGYNHGNPSGVFGCHPNDSIPWVTGMTGSMFGAESRYLKRAVDYRSVLGELIRDHLGATQNQLDRIIPGYAVAGENLSNGGTSSVDGTAIMGELGLV